jgi:hypothetical protein
MDGSALVWVFVVFGVVAAALAYYAHQRRLERQHTLRRLALNEGLDFTTDDPFDTLGQPFSLLQEGDGRGVENVLWGFWHGLEIRAFDYWYYEESSGANGGSSRSYSRFNCVIALVEASCPQLRIAPESVLTRIAAALSFDDIAFESEEFNRAFHVQGRDRRFATALVDARMMEWLLRKAQGYCFEVTGDRFLCWTRQVEPAAVLDLLATAKTFHDRIPAVVSSLYPR